MASEGGRRRNRSKQRGDGQTFCNVKVAVRVRPFNEREVDAKARPCVYMSGKTVAVVNKQGKNKSFTYDYCYWSLSRSGPNEYADQQRIFEDLAVSFVEHSFEGYNSSVFAYGQTGSGKSYTMMGTQQEPGIIPRGCDELFRRINESSEHYEVEAAYMEVYLDRIYDLLEMNNTKKKKRSHKRQKLPIRFHPKSGAYVEGLTKHAVENFTDVKSLLRAGINNRTIAATQMNKISSRSHSIFVLYVHHHREDGKVRTSKINLIDLAGSERVSKSLAEGQRLEELKKINRSLSALGDVIHALASAAKFVPYNNSVLTTLLKQSLGGNSKSIMIATISPCATSVDETLSTLRYAARAKRIQNKIKQNQGQTNESAERHLRAEISRLRKLLALRSNGNGDQVSILKQHLDAYRDELRRRAMSYKQKVAEMRDQVKERDVALNNSGVATQEDLIKYKKEPRFVNISEDPSLTGNLVYIMKSNEVVIGSSPESGFVLISKDSSIKPQHAILIKEKITKEDERMGQVEKWHHKFKESDVDNDGELCFAEFQTFVSALVGDADEYNDLTEMDFIQICEKVGSESHSLNWNHARQLFGMIFEQQTSNDNGDVLKLMVRGIPVQNLDAQILNDIKKYVFRGQPKKISIEGNEIIAIFNSELNSDIIANYEKELRSLLSETNYSQNVHIIPQSQKKANTVTRVSIQAAGLDDALMIFVNGVRVTNEPYELNHRDRIVFGTYHEFQLINPSNRERTRDRVAQSITNNPSKRRKSNQLPRDQPIIQSPNSSFTSRPSSRRRKRRDTSVRMEDYRSLAHKAAQANEMCEELGKPTSYNVGTMTYYDPDSYRRADAMVVTRSSQYTTPELQHLMGPKEFQSELSELTVFYTLMKDKGEEQAAKILGVNPFIPGDLETGAGRAQLVLQSRKLTDDIIQIPIIQNSNPIGKISLKLIFKPDGETPIPHLNLNDLLNSKSLVIEVQILTIEFTEAEMKNVFLVYTFVGQELQWTSQVDDSDEMSLFHEINYSQNFRIPHFTKALLNYMSTIGVNFTVWGNLFEELDGLPGEMIEKSHMKRMNIMIEREKRGPLTVQIYENSKILMLKRRLEDETGILWNNQVLLLGNTELFDNQTLSASGLKDGIHVQLISTGNNSESSQSVEVINSHIKKIVPAPRTLDECKKQNVILRERLAQALSIINNLKNTYESKLWEGKFIDTSNNEAISLIQHSDGKQISIIKDSEPRFSEGVINGFEITVRLPDGNTKTGRTTDGKTVQFDDHTSWRMVHPKNLEKLAPRSTRASSQGEN